MINNNTPVRNGLSAKSAGPLSMISMLAISAGIAAAPAQAQSVIAPSDMPMQSPVAVPTPSPAPAPAMQSPPVTSIPSAEARTIAPVTPNGADDLATQGGFGAATVAPEALAQIEREQQARQAAAKAAAAKAASTTASPARVRTDSAPALASAASTPVATTGPANGEAETMNAESTGDSVAGFDAVPPIMQSTPATPEGAATPADLSGETDWGLLAALAALLGVGSVGAYAASRRRKVRAQPVVAADQGEPDSDPVMAATMPELRGEPVVAEPGSAALAAQRSASTKTDFSAFVGNLPPFEAPRSKADRHVKNAQRRVAAAPRPYLGEADLSRQSGYFMAHVDAMPTPQNPFLTRQMRLKRARHLDRKLVEIKAANAMRPNQVSGTMEAARPLEPAYS